MGLMARVKRLDKTLSGGGPPRDPVMLSIVLDGDVPEWATEAVHPYVAPEGVTIVTWRESVDGRIYAEIRGAWYHVTPDGCQPIETPDVIPFTVGPKDWRRPDATN